MGNLREVKSFPFSAVHTRFSEMSEVLLLDPREVVELTYRDGRGGTVLLIHPQRWREALESVPVADSEIGAPLPFRDARRRISAVRRQVAYDGVHVPITSHGHEHVVMVPSAWAHLAGLYATPAE